jgi:hypothetical protein
MKCGPARRDRLTGPNPSQRSAMAKDKMIDTTREWVWLGDYLDRKTAELRSSELADKVVRNELDTGQHSVSYYDADGRPHQNGLPDRFWRKAIMDRETSSAEQPNLAYIQLDELDGFWSMDKDTATKLLVELGYALGRSVKIGGVRVLVPQEKCAAVPATAEVVVSADATIDPFKTGAAGRPSAAKVLCAEAERRIAEHDISQNTLKDFAASLLAWLYKTHPGAPNTSQKNAETILRSLWTSWKRGREKPGN